MSIKVSNIGEIPKIFREWFLLPVSQDLVEGDHKVKVVFQKLKTIDPKDYFKTTGDAMAKLAVLEKDCWELAGQVRALKNLCKKTLGKEKWLETTIDEEGRVLCSPKTPKRETLTTVPGEGSVPGRGKTRPKRMGRPH